MAASGGIGDILKWGLILGGGYVLYRSFASAPAAASSGSTAGTGTQQFTLADLMAALKNAGTTPATGTPAASSAPLAAALKTAATGNAFLVNGQLTADQWRFYYERLPGKSAIDGGVFDAVFFPSGRPAAESGYTRYSPEDFAAALATKGLSGLGARREFQAPALAYRGPHGRPVLVTRSGVVSVG